MFFYNDRFSMDILHRKLLLSGGCLRGAKKERGFLGGISAKPTKKEDKTVLKKAEKKIDKMSAMG